MIYRHAAKAGNRADAWKHFILAEILTAMLPPAADPEASFRYLETHAGTGAYRLGQNGPWRTGAAVISRSAHALSDNPYICGLMASPPIPGSLYYGSWVVAGRILLKHVRVPVIEVCDIDPEIRSALTNGDIPAALRRTLAIHCADGFEILEKTDRPDFVLIDPPYVPDFEKDRRRTLAAAERLDALGVAGLIWYPILEDKPLRERQTNRPGYEIAWSNEKEEGPSKMTGCGILGTGSARTGLARLTHRMRLLSSALTAQFRVRQL